MARHGRFGKYGDIKRMERLRKAKASPIDVRTVGIKWKGERPSQRSVKNRRNRLTIRPAAVEDMGYVQSLSKKVFEQYGPYEETLPAWLKAGTTVTIVAGIKKKPVGFAMLGPPIYRRYSPKTCELLAIAVEPEKHRQGIGNFLMKEILLIAGQMEVHKLVLHTGLDNLAGQNLFKKCGFVPSDIKRSFYPEGQHALMMAKEIG